MMILRVKLRFISYLLLLWIPSVCFYIIYVNSIGSELNRYSLEGHFWVFSDSHIDIFYQSQSIPKYHCHNRSFNNNGRYRYGQFKCDSPIELLYSAFLAARKIDAKIDFIIWLGDAASHTNSYYDATVQVQRNISQELRRYFPQTLIIPVLGNHDIVLNEKANVRIKNLYYNTNYNLLLNDEYARETFIKGGYYSRRYKTLEENSYLRFIVLNSAMFQPEYVNFFENYQANEQISWFNRTMFEAVELNDRVLILGHVSFGIDETYLTKLHSSEYEQKLLSIIDMYSKNIIMYLCGHRHQDLFRVYKLSNSIISILNHPPITPHDFNNQPAIRYYSYNRKLLVLNDYEQYRFDLLKTNQWYLSYRFSSLYDQPKELTSRNLNELVTKIATNISYFKKFLTMKYFRRENQLANENTAQTLCSITHFNFSQFDVCVNSLKGDKIN